MSLLSLPPDAWSEVLHYLPPSDLTLASTSVSRALSSANAGAVERAAWLAVRAAYERSFGLFRARAQAEADADSHASNGVNDEQEGASGVGEAGILPAPSDCVSSLKRYSSETWLGLYRLLFSLAETEASAEAGLDIDAASETEEHQQQEQHGGMNGPPNNGDEDEAADTDSASEREEQQQGQQGGMNGSPYDGDDNEAVEEEEKKEKRKSRGNHSQVATATMWLVFGAPPLPSRSQVQNVVLACVVGSWIKILRDGTCGYVPRSRIIQSSLRLGDAGQWDLASDLLKAMNKGGDDGEESNAGVEGEDFSTVDAKICAATFLVDRLYSNTFVRDDEGDSEDLASAVRIGREAVEQCSLRDATAANDRTSPMSNGAPPAGIAASVATATGRSSNARPPAPPPITSLFATATLRLAAARLALARALALLAQHVGLGAMVPSRFGIHPMVETGSDDSELSAQRAWFTDQRAWFTEQFFREGLGHIESSLTALNAAGATEGPIDLCEMFAATIAARGELFYCAASANTVSFVPLLSRQVGDGIVLDRMSILEDLVRRSIADLRRSFELVGKRLTEVEDLAPMVDVWCVNAPRSLMLLQSRTAKDLGKVCDFASHMGLHSLLISPNESRQLLSFAHAVSLRLHGELHPSTHNIERLAQRHPGQDTEEGQAVDRWLEDRFGTSLQL